MQLETYSFGIGDRFAQQGEAQLRALQKARSQGIDLVPVWNKSHREHLIIGSSPEDTRAEADRAVTALGWDRPYYVDADHINLDTVDPFIGPSDFFTLDVADFIGTPASPDASERFLKAAGRFMGSLEIPGISEPVTIDRNKLETVRGKFLGAVEHAAAIYRHIAGRKGEGNFVAEVSMDEVDEPQSPVELFFILQMISLFGIPAQTIAPKFSGRFNKGVDYAGEVDRFRTEFGQDLRVIDHAVRTFGLPENLKLSIHSGSDKFSIYPVMGELIGATGKGIHVKTAGTTWLEEVIGLAMAEGDGLALAKKIYARAHSRREELCSPYSAVIDIDPSELPAPSEVDAWNGERFAGALRHIPGHPFYHPGFRQLIHVGYKVAAELGTDFTEMVNAHSGIIGDQVESNLYNRHICRLFNLQPDESISR